MLNTKPVLVAPVDLNSISTSLFALTTGVFTQHSIVKSPVPIAKAALEGAVK